MLWALEVLCEVHSIQCYKEWAMVNFYISYYVESKKHQWMYQKLTIGSNWSGNDIYKVATTIVWMVRFYFHF